MTEDKLNITIRIAGQKPMAMRIDRQKEETVRTAEYQVNRLWERWVKRFPEKAALEVLGMVAYQFAELYYSSLKSSEEAQKLLDGFEPRLDSMLHDLGQAQPPGSESSPTRL